MTLLRWATMSQSSIPSEMVNEHCQRSVYLPFTHILFAEMKPHFTKEKRSHSHCRINPKVAFEHNGNKIEKAQSMCDREAASCYSCTSALHGKMI